MLSETMKRHIKILAERKIRGEYRGYEKFLGYIKDATIQGLVLPDDAIDILNEWVDNSDRPAYSNEDYKLSNSFKMQLSVLRRVMEDK